MAVLNWAQAMLGGDGNDAWTLRLNLAFVAVSLLAVSVLTSFLRDKWKRRKLPPGPPGIPFLGNAWQLLTIEFPWLQFTEWREKYGMLLTVICFPGTIADVLVERPHYVP